MSMIRISPVRRALTFAAGMLSLLCLGGVSRAGTPADRDFDADRAFRDLLRQCDFGPRVPGSQGHRECAAWLSRELARSADSVRQYRFSVALAGGRLDLVNLEATFNPDGRGHALLCAHWDTRPIADRDPDPASRGKPIAGANDGASGVAVLLEIGRALKAHPPKQRVTIVLFDGEDYGSTPAEMFFGSRHYASYYAGPIPDWAVLLDMVGDRDLRLPPERFSQQKAPGVVDRVWGAAERAGCEAFVRAPGPAVLDDHVPLLARGIPCVNVIDFDYPHWHTLADTPDKCAPESLAQVGRAVLRALAEDEQDQPDPEDPQNGQ